MAKATKVKAKAKAAPEPEVEDDEELEEVDEPTTSKAASDEVTFGASDLAAHLSEGRDKPITAREIRTLIRKMARDGSGRVNREIRQGNRTRYNWSGLNDPEVKAIIKAFNAGELEQDKQEKLAALKARNEAKRAEKQAAAAKGEKVAKSGKKKVKPAPVVEDDDEELELDDEE